MKVIIVLIDRYIIFVAMKQYSDIYYDNKVNKEITEINAPSTVWTMENKHCNFKLSLEMSF